MKHLTILAFLFVACAGMAIAQKSVPSVTVKTLDGQTINLKDYIQKSGKIVVIDFWATWCSPCKKELDAIAEYYEDWQKQYGMELIAITIDNQRALPKVPAMVESKGWKYTIFSGNEEQMRTAFNFQTIPQTLVVDAKGNIVWQHNGYVPGDELELEQVIAKTARK